MGAKLKEDSVGKADGKETKEMAENKETEKKETEKSAIEEAIDKKIENMKKEDSKDKSDKDSDKESDEKSVKESDKDTDEKSVKESDKDSDEKSVKESNKELDERTEKKSDKDSDEKTDKESLADIIPEIVIPTPYIDSSVEKHKNKKKVRLAVLSSILGILVILYIAGVVYYSKYFNANTYLNGYDISGKTVAEVETIFNDMVFSKYCLEVQFKNDSQMVNVGDGNMYVEPVVPIIEYKNKQNPFMWIFNINAENKYLVDYRVCYDDEVLKAYLETFDVMKSENMTPSVDAYVKFEEGEAVIIPDVTGTVLDKEKVFVSVKEALDSNATFVNIDEKGCYIPADIRSDSASILQTYDNAKDYLSIEASYEFCEDYTYTLSTEELAMMAYIDDNGIVQISKTNARMFIDDFAERFTTVKEDRKFRTHNGDLILVEGGKWYGWVINAEEEFEEFYNLIITKKSFTKEPVCDRRGYSYSEINDIGDSYIEIDLTQQHVYVYIDGYLETHSRCVTGDLNSGHKTPGGVYSITYMALDVVLTGADYESPVTFWMPFNGGIGLHDATWRYSFDDDTYTYDGSHGCINLPWENARDIFYMVESGMPVICYWEDEVTFLEEE